jgi:hypothetical protein
MVFVLLRTAHSAPHGSAARTLNIGTAEPMGEDDDGRSCVAFGSALVEGDADAEGAAKRLVASKPVNGGGRPSSEPVEQRGEAEG